MSQTELQGQITSQDDSNEDGESFHIEASEAPLGINAAVRPPPPATFADGLQLHVNPRSKSGYTRVESLPDGRFRVSVDNAAQIGLLETCMMMPHDHAVDMHDVQGVHDERAMFLPAQGLDAEHTEQPLGIYATALEAATVYARYARMRVPQVALATALATAVALRCAAVCSTAWPNNTISPI